MKPEREAVTTLVELCAGTASVSLWAIARCGPLTGYMGSKRRWASRLVQALGADRPDRVVLVDAGPWGDAWSVLRDREHRRHVAETLDGWSAMSLPDLWAWLVALRPPADSPAWRVAQYLVLQVLEHRTRPLWWDHEWVTTTGPPALRATASPQWRTIPPSTIAARVRALDALPWDRIEVVHGDCRGVDPIPGATVYLDPPYVGCPRYAALLPRGDVLERADRWVEAGCRVAISEATALDLPGWTSRRLARREYVTASWPIALPEQGELFASATV